jgi:hypothetical protein
VTDITHINPSSQISDGPTNIKDIILKVLSHCSGPTFPVTDNEPGRLAYINSSSLVVGNRGWLFVYNGEVGGAPDWRKLLQISSRPPSGAEFDAAIGSKENVINGAASSIAHTNLAAEQVVVSDVSGKIATIAISLAEVFALDGIRTDVSVQTQLDGKQPNIVASTAEPTAADAVGRPDNTVWYVYLP